MNHTELIKNIGSIEALNLFKEDIMRVDPQGFIILLDGERIKPRDGKVDIYPSVNAAITALTRNSSAAHKLKASIMHQALGFNWNTDKEKYHNYFYNPDVKDKNGFTVSGGYKNNEVWEQRKAIDKAACNAMLHYIKQWLKEGRLEIKQL